MSSKKHRKKIKAFYLRQAAETRSIQLGIDEKASVPQNINHVLDKLRGFSVVFPEISSEPIKLGQLLEVSIKIGDDEVQKKRLVYATIILPSEKTKSSLNGLVELLANSKEKVIIAPRTESNFSVTSILNVIYPAPMGGYAMTPIAIFAWYGKEEITISEIEKCSPEVSELIDTPLSCVSDTIWSGSYSGRQIDGIEIFDDAIAS